MSLLALPAAGPAQAESARSRPMSALLVAVFSMTVPPSANLGSAAPGGSIADAQLGSMTVNASGIGAWTVTVSATGFTTPPGGTGRTIANSSVSYWSGNYTAKSGLGVFTPGQLTSSDEQTLSVARTAFTHTGITASTSVTWNPHLVVSVPLTTMAGTYTGTVTHSVA